MPTLDERETIRREAREAALRNTAEFLLEALDQRHENGYHFCPTITSAMEDVRAALAAAPAPNQPAPQRTVGERLVAAAKEAGAIAKGEAEPASIFPAPQCVACDDSPQPPNPPCAVCGQNAPQPDAEEREAMVYLIEYMLQEHPAQHESAWHRAHYVADALLEAGWTHKREEG